MSASASGRNPIFGIVPYRAASADLSCVDLRVLLVICGHANHQDHHRCFLSTRFIAEKSKADRRSVQRSIGNLEEKRLIEVHRRRRGSVHVYVVLLDDLEVAGVDPPLVAENVAGVDPPCGGSRVAQVAGVDPPKHTKNIPLNKDARARASRLMGALASSREDMTAGEYGLLQSRLQSYERTGSWDDDIWGPMPPWLDDGAVVLDVDQADEQHHDEPIPELRREAGP